MKLRCIIVDDESLARKLLEDNIAQLNFLELVGVCKNAFEAIDILQQKTIDLMFLDIQMPGMIGTKFLQSLTIKPMVIFVTAYSNYALEGYELNVVDYIMKPVSMDRFTKAAMKALHEKQKLQALDSASPTVSNEENKQEDYFFVPADYALVKITIADISHLESMKDYVKIYLTTSSKPVITKSTLRAMEEKLSIHSFVRVHKSFVVNLSKIESIRNQSISIGTHLIPISDSYLDAVMKVVNEKK
jgi:DNA-binding LytR/AlgR family response regulator